MDVKSALHRLIIVKVFLCPIIFSEPLVPSSDRSFGRLLIASIPKCGTHLISKLIDNLGYKYQHLTITSLIKIPADIQTLEPGFYYINHFISSAENMDTIKALGIKLIFIYRDPRDQIVSLAYYMKKHFSTWIASELPLETIISKLIVDYSTICHTNLKDPWNDPLLETIGGVNNFYSLYLKWFTYPDIYITSFEKLVGNKGGGNDEVQFQEISNIAKYLEIDISQKKLKKIQTNLFGNSETFREGRIGNWKKHFSEKDKETFKKIAGQLLIDLGYEKDLNW